MRDSARPARSTDAIRVAARATKVHPELAATGVSVNVLPRDGHGRLLRRDASGAGERGGVRPRCGGRLAAVTDHLLHT
ncbi:hypothetical protein QQY66_43110 [Streptomyces sp. DG2A-72]|uniref:hypothetical protein n=1 Tax=Streptomyces sp. DG2A-72 TaxID=3051386 RepID=UPI00265C67CB|nr:hypothetical protein [Streptomyces sp. DG2A-72]MDO0938189.1 hypothetical protein [Streptomyces sp. DG2A-72]